MYEVRFYETFDGKVPFRDWHGRMRDFQAKVAIDRRIQRAEGGNFGDHRFCGQGVWELRINMGPGYRVYYAVAESMSSVAMWRR